MNNPGLEESVQSAAEDAERTLRKRLQQHLSSLEGHESGSNSSSKEALRKELRSDTELRRNNEQCFQPKRWWFTSTAFPLIAGTFGPLANLMSVCALVMTWQVTILPGQTEGNGERVGDPNWLIAVNAISLVFAIAANLLLLFNFAHRVRYAIAQPLTILFWYIAAILLMSLVIAAHKYLRLPPKNHAFSQAFYYAIISAILYFIISTLLLWNMMGAYVFKAYRASFTSLTIPQRTLMLQTISYTLYLSIGAGLFSELEGWSFVDGLYWANYTLLTIGFGSDFPLKGQVARGLMIPYAVGGIIMIGLVIGSVRGLFFERGKIKVRNRALVKERKKILRDFKSAECDWQQEFALMRGVQEAADRSRRYWGLGTSFLAFLIVWFGGAMAFTFSEQPQGWTYFEAMYFTFVALVTIGYGDLYPQSNLGKPFFVLWSLIAVPAVTILISNMGDTVVDWVEKGTLWLGQKTILPEKTPYWYKSPTEVHKEVDEEEARENQSSSLEAGLLQDVELIGHIVEESGKKAEKGGVGSQQHKIGKMIAREIVKLAKDIGAKPPRKYDWEEWKRFLELLGEMGDGNGDVEWKWIGDDGMLFSGVTETEYLLGKLCERLEQVLVDGKTGN